MAESLADRERERDTLSQNWITFIRELKEFFEADRIIKNISPVSIDERAKREERIRAN